MEDFLALAEELETEIATNLNEVTSYLDLANMIASLGMSQATAISMESEFGFESFLADNPVGCFSKEPSAFNTEVAMESILDKIVDVTRKASKNAYRILMKLVRIIAKWFDDKTSVRFVQLSPDSPEFIKTFYEVFDTEADKWIQTSGNAMDLPKSIEATIMENIKAITASIGEYKRCLKVIDATVKDYLRGEATLMAVHEKLEMSWDVELDMLYKLNSYMTVRVDDGGPNTIDQPEAPKFLPNEAQRVPTGFSRHIAAVAMQFTEMETTKRLVTTQDESGVVLDNVLMFPKESVYEEGRAIITKALDKLSDELNGTDKEIDASMSLMKTASARTPKSDLSLIAGAVKAHTLYVTGIHKVYSDNIRALNQTAMLYNKITRTMNGMRSSAKA